jgi:uncharacterized protein with von Willebrand factor type A (vWA) domain
MQTQLGDARSGKLVENLLGFGRALRRAGIAVDSAKLSLASQALLWINLSQRDECYAALASTLLSRYQDQQVFKDVFERYFTNPDLANQLLGQMLPRTEEKKSLQKNDRAREALRGKQLSSNPGSPQDHKIELDASMTLSDHHRLRYADFNGLNTSEYQLIEQLAKGIKVKFPKMPSRRYRPHHRGHQLDFRKIIQSSIRLNNELLEIHWQRRKTYFLPLLILVDVSGSMERYARLLLSFLHAATRHHPNTEVLSFGTKLTHLTQSFANHDTDRMLLDINDQIQDFASGTQLGSCLDELNTQYGKLMIGKRTVVLLITDGLDTGSSEILHDALTKLKRQSKSILWLNPLMRYEAYQPIASGPAELAKVADKMIAIHNLQSLQELSKHLEQLLSNTSSATKLI